MLKMNTEENRRKVRYPNFTSSLSKDLKQYKREFWDPFTRQTVELDAFYVDPKTLDAQGAISALQELKWHLQWVLLKEKPDASRIQLGCVWKQRCRQTEILIASVKRRLDNLLWELFQENCLTDPGEMITVHPSLGLRTADDHILYWYVKDCFAHDMDEETIHAVRLKLEYQMIDWLDEMDEMSEKDADVEFTPHFQLQKFRCEEKQMQLDQLDRIKNGDAHERRKKALKAAYDHLPVGIAMDQAPQWLGMPELVEEIEKIKLCMKQSKDLPNDLLMELNAKSDALLDELNRRMISIICTCTGCNAADRKNLENVAPQEGIAYPVCFLEGSALERPEDYIYCWYLNERFPYHMGLEQQRCVEAALKQQLDALEEMQDMYKNDEKSSLWYQSCVLKEKQLEEIKEDIFFTESELLYWDEIQDVIE